MHTEVWEPAELAENPTPHRDPADYGLALGRSVLLASLAVVALAAWALNMGYMAEHINNMRWSSIAIRVLFLDAIPLAILWVIFCGVGKKRTLESTLRHIGQSLTGWRTR